jgi:hypothetical protein
LGREDFAHGGTAILPVRTAKMAVPLMGCGPAALSHELVGRCQAAEILVVA